MGLAWAKTGAGAIAAPPATRATVSAARTVTLSVFIDVSSLEGLNEPGDDSRKGRFGLAPLVVGRLSAFAVRNHDQLEIGHALEPRLGASRCLEVIPDDGDGV